MPYKNIENKRASWRRYYARHKTEIKQQIRRRKAANRKLFQEYKKTLKCKRCPENHPACLDFHHKEGKKEQYVSVLAARGYGMKRILEEIKKCEVLCSNCHKKLHYALQ